MRIKTGPYRRRKHQKVRKLAKGYRMTRHRLHKVASDAVLHAGEYAYIGRKDRKGDFRRLWISRIGAALSEFDIPYREFIAGLKKADIELDRKILAEIAISDPQTFKVILDKVKT